MRLAFNDKECVEQKQKEKQIPVSCYSDLTWHKTAPVAHKIVFWENKAIDLFNLFQTVKKERLIMKRHIYRWMMFTQEHDDTSYILFKAFQMKEELTRIQENLFVFKITEQADHNDGE